MLWAQVTEGKGDSPCSSVSRRLCQPCLAHQKGSDHHLSQLEDLPLSCWQTSPAVVPAQPITLLCFCGLSDGQRRCAFSGTASLCVKRGKGFYLEMYCKAFSVGAMGGVALSPSAATEKPISGKNHALLTLAESVLLPPNSSSQLCISLWRWAPPPPV